jgi:hypothetical protein
MDFGTEGIFRPTGRNMTYKRRKVSPAISATAVAQQAVV